MRNTNPSRKFIKDYKRCQARGLDAAKIQAIISLLMEDQELPDRCRPHKLSGEWSGLWECHVAPDWLLIYDLDDEANSLDLIRTGTHADLFR